MVFFSSLDKDTFLHSKRLSKAYNYVLNGVEYVLQGLWDFKNSNKLGPFEQTKKFQSTRFFDPFSTY